MLSLNIFPPARIQIGILIRLSLNFEHTRQRLQRHKTSLVSLSNVMLFLSKLPPSRAQLELILHKSNRRSQDHSQSSFGLTKQMFQVPFVESVWTVEKAPFSTYKVEGIHQVGATQVLGGGWGCPRRVEYQQQQHGHRPWYPSHRRGTSRTSEKECTKGKITQRDTLIKFL